MPKKAVAISAPSSSAAQSHRLKKRSFGNAVSSACAAAQRVETAPMSIEKSWASISSVCTSPSRGRALARISIRAPQTCCP